MPLFLLALVPALAITYYYYNRDRHPEPWGLVSVVFIFGALAAFVAYPLERWAQSFFPHPGSRKQLFLECLMIPGVIEETIKLFVVVAAVWWHRDFDEPVDGLIYGTAAALGFTFGEDWRYYVLHGADATRLLTTIAHPWFSCFWAASLGWAKVRPRMQGLGLVLLGLVASILVHALFDFLILAADSDERWAWLRAGLVPLLVGLYWTTEKQLEALQRESQPPSSAPPAAPPPTKEAGALPADDTSDTMDLVSAGTPQQRTGAD
jgi:protease PrsW